MNSQYYQTLLLVAQVSLAVFFAADESLAIESSATAAALEKTTETNPLKNTFCNPLNLEYNFWDAPGYREAADPVVVTFQNEYYLFASHSSGYWWSKDMVNWHLVANPSGLANIDRYAPAILVLGDTMYFTAKGGAIYQTKNPKSGRWEYVSTPLNSSDPCLFQDDDGRVYLYTGLGEPSIYVVELDPSSKFAPKGGLETCFTRPGEKLEGSWMVTHGGLYYLYYATGGTGHATYNDNYYVGKSPQGPFTFSRNNPFNFRPQGFVTGTAHSCTFKDLEGNYWQATTTLVGVMHRFERRISIFPAGFDRDNLLHVDSYLGDYPQFAPGHAPANAQRDAAGSNLAGTRLLSFHRPAATSSALTNHPAADAFDENMKTWWSATTANAGEWMRVDLEKQCVVEAVQVNFGEQDTTYHGRRPNAFSIKYKIEGAETIHGPWTVLVDKTANMRDVPHDYVALNRVAKARYVRITNAGPMPAGGKFAVRDLRVFGLGPGDAPGTVPSFSVSRAANKTSATVTWKPVAKAEGYVIRYGIAPDKLYSQCQVLGGDSSQQIIKFLAGKEPLYFTLDSYGPGGLKQGTLIQTESNYEVDDKK